METLSLLRTIGALGVVLGLLVGVLWAVRRFDLTLPQKWLEVIHKQGSERRLEVLEKLALDPRRSVVLIRKDDQEYSVLIAPEGILMLDLKPNSSPVSHSPSLTPTPAAPSTTAPDLSSVTPKMQDHDEDQ